MVAAADDLPLDVHAHEDERARDRTIGCVALEPFQETEGEVQRADARLFRDGPRGVADLRELPLQCVLQRHGLELDRPLTGPSRGWASPEVEVRVEA